jgi:cytoskeletal protein CcmA (bactofilin family)
MFSKDKKDGAGKRKAAPPTIISADLRVNGNVTSDGEIQIDSIVDGDVRSNKLSVGQSGRIKGAVTAEKMLVRGRVIGEIRARVITLASTARVKGDALHETLTIEPGAQLEGHCRPMETVKQIEGAAQPGEGGINLVVSDGTISR